MNLWLKCFEQARVYRATLGVHVPLDLICPYKANIEFPARHLVNNIELVPGEDNLLKFQDISLRKLGESWIGCPSPSELDR